MPDCRRWMWMPPSRDRGRVRCARAIRSDDEQAGLRRTLRRLAASEGCCRSCHGGHEACRYRARRPVAQKAPNGSPHIKLMVDLPHRDLSQRAGLRPGFHLSWAGLRVTSPRHRRPAKCASIHRGIAPNILARSKSADPWHAGRRSCVRYGCCARALAWTNSLKLRSIAATEGWTSGAWPYQTDSSFAASRASSWAIA